VVSKLPREVEGQPASSLRLPPEGDAAGNVLTDNLCNPGGPKGDTTTWEPVLDLHGHENYVKSLVFSPDGTQLASGSGDETVRIWDTVPQAERHRQVMETRAR